MKFKELMECIALGALSVLLGILSLTLYEAGPYVINTLISLESAANHTKLAMIDLSDVAREEKTQLTSDHFKRAEGLWLDTGKQAYRASLKVNTLLDLINYQTAPKVNRTIDTTTNTVLHIDGDIATIAPLINATIGKVDISIDSVNKLLNDPNLPLMLANIAKLTGDADLTVADFDQLVKDIRPRLDANLDSSKLALDNGAELLKQLGITVKEINKPVTKKQRALNILLQLIIPAIKTFK